MAKLIEVGIDSNQIITQIHGEKYSMQEINRNDRKVKHKEIRDKLFQNTTQKLCVRSIEMMTILRGKFTTLVKNVTKTLQFIVYLIVGQLR